MKVSKITVRRYNIMILDLCILQIYAIARILRFCYLCLSKQSKKMSKHKLQIRNSTAEFLIFTSQTGKDGIDVRFENETTWLSQKLMAVLFDCSTDNISLHLKNIFKSGELNESSVSE